ncbi:MAG: hypothetical protein J5I98_03370 [Phaeodactylibacter sp.]|nr:hypothetical protein [Phaeodactylibacter sp.]
MKRFFDEHLKFISGKIGLTHQPRWTLPPGTLMVGPYRSSEEHELHLAKTNGSGDSIFDSTDELRFDLNDRMLVSCRVGLAENPYFTEHLLKAILSIETEQGSLELIQEHGFQIPSSNITWIDPDGQWLLAVQGVIQPEHIEQRLRLAPNLDLVIGSGNICGWLLSQPGDYLVKSIWDDKVNPPTTDSLSKYIAAYILMMNTEFINQLEGSSDHAKKMLFNYLEELRSNCEFSPQRQILIDSVNTILDTFFS